MSNPFTPALVRMQAPACLGRSISVRGINLETDEKGIVEVPKDVAAELEPHGFTKAPDAPPAKK